MLVDICVYIHQENAGQRCEKMITVNKSVIIAQLLSFINYG